MDVCVKFEETPSKRSWDIMLTRMAGMYRRVDRQPEHVMPLALANEKLPVWVNPGFTESSLVKN